MEDLLIASGDQAAIPPASTSNDAKGGAPNLGMYKLGNLVGVSDSVNETTRPIDYIIAQARKIIAGKDAPKIMVVKAKTGSGKTIVMPPELYLQLNVPVAVGVPLVKTTTDSPVSVMSIYPQLANPPSVGSATSRKVALSRKIDYLSTAILQMQIREAIDIFKTSNGRIEAVRERFPYRIIVIDEVHQHNDSIDLTLVAAKYMVRLFKNDSPLIVITSATIEVEDFLRYFDIPGDNWGDHAVTVQGSSSVQTLIYTPTPVANWVTASAELVIKICTEIDPEPSYKKGKPGDIVIFIPTISKGERIKSKIDEWAAKAKYPLLCIVGTSSIINSDTREHRLLEAPDPTEIEPRVHGRTLARLVIIGTNAIETGVTLPNPTHVIECGLSYEVTYNPRLGCMIQLISPISRASAIQRAGRVGRKFPGTVHFLYTEETYNKMRPEKLPFTHTEDFARSLLFLRVLEIPPEDLIFPPTHEMLYDAEDKLYMLGFLDNTGCPTELGQIVSNLPILPPESIKMIFAGIAYGVCMADLLTIACAVESRSAGDTPTIMGIDDQFISTLMMVERMLFPQELSQYDSKFRYAPEGEAKGDETPLWGILAFKEILKMRSDVYKYFSRINISLDNVPSVVQSVLFAGDPASEEYRQTVAQFKRCIYEGYRGNLIIHRGDSYQTCRGFNVEEITKIYGTRDDHYRRMGLSDSDEPTYLIARDLSVREIPGLGISLSASCLSILDGYIAPDDDQLPQFTRTVASNITMSPGDIDEYAASLIGREQPQTQLIYNDGEICKSTYKPPPASEKRPGKIGPKRHGGDTAGGINYCSCSQLV